jgi:protein SCO1
VIRVAFAVAMITLMLWAAPAAMGHELPREEVASARFTQHLGNQLPLDANFLQEDGNAVRLGRYFGDKPVLLSLNYFHCQYVCPIEEDAVINTLNGVMLTPGRDFTLLTVSIDPHDGPSDATAVKARAVRGYDRPEGADGWHLLTGDAESIRELTSAIGFQYVPDPLQGDFAHPIGLVVLTPEGKISSYLSGVDFASGDVSRALSAAANAKSDDVFATALVVCYQYDPLTGRYTPLALNAVRIAGALGVVALLAWLGSLWRADLRRSERGA